MRKLMVAAVVVGCGTSVPIAASSTGYTPPVPLSDIQKECRANELSFIATASGALVGSCTRTADSLALLIFDQGSYEGEVDGRDISDATMWVCICAETKCSDKVAKRVIDRAQKVMVTNEGKRERDGLTEIMDSMANHPCLYGAAAAMLYQKGFRCSSSARSSPRWRAADNLSVYRDIFSGDEAKALELQRKCDAPRNNGEE